MRLALEDTLLGVDVPDLDVVTRRREDPLGGRVELDVARFATVRALTPEGFNVGEVLFAIVGPGIVQELVVDASQGEGAVLSDRGDERVVKGRPGRVEDGSGMTPAKREQVRKLQTKGVINFEQLSRRRVSPLASERKRHSPFR